jgi:hypothetical protein
MGAPTVVWVSVGASPAGPTSKGQPDVEDFKAGSLGEDLSAPSEPGLFLACHCYYRSARGTKKDPRWRQAVIDFQHASS